MTHRKLSIPMLLALAFVASLAASPANAAPNVGALAGTWEITGTPQPTACGPAVPFTNLTSIGRNGEIVNVDPAVGIGVGEAYRTGPKVYAVGFFGFITPAPGIMLKYEVQANATLVNSGEFNGQFRTIVTDTAGVIPDCVFEGDIVAFRQVPMPY